MTRRTTLISLTALLVVVACAAVYYFVLSGPAYRTTVLVDTSAPGTGLPQIAGAVRAVAGNSGDADALSVRRFGGECGNPGDTAEIADSPGEVAQAVGALSPSGKATMVDGVLAAIADFSGLTTRRGSVRNRIVIVTTSGLDACTNDPAGARKAIDDRLAKEGLDLDIRVVGFQIPPDRKEAVTQFAGASNAAFAVGADDLQVVLDRLVVPASPDAASLSVSTSPPEPEPSYAFLTSKRLGLVRGTKVVAETTGEFVSTSSVQYTVDGHFVFAATMTDIATIDVRSGVVKVVPCGTCWDAVAADGSVISWLADNVVTTIDLADTSAKPQAGVTLLPNRKVDRENMIDPLRILAGQNGNILFSAPEGVSHYGGGGENLYLARSDGQVVPVGLAQGNVAISGTTFSPDGRSAAYISAWHTGACEERSSVVLLDLTTGVHEETSAVDAPDSDGAGVESLWYDKDGTLNMLYTAWRCAASGGPTTSTTIPESHWRLENSRWTQRGPDSTGYTRQAGPGLRAVLANRDEQTNTHELFSEVDGTRTKIADGVSAIAVPN